ncbi:vWA domain-containing protein [Gracilibacillus oryzae]|uniref:vWA domain-containing protein n=1 Tax=Gracilibacillus oryzae TaxID=1672701 RepID=UPI001885B933|nr:VWA domain-containing protein [Gracilibacillus oryzae]
MEQDEQRDDQKSQGITTEDSESQNNEENSEQEQEANEETSDPLANLLERVPEEPSNLEEIIAYPVGPLAGNGSITGKEPVMETEELVNRVMEVLPPIEEQQDETYYDQWWRALRYLFAEDYPDPRQVIKELNYTHFGNDALEDERFRFKDQINVLLVLDVSGSMANEVDGKSMLQIAKDSILNFASDIPEDANVGVRIYGHEGASTGLTKEESCQATDLIYDFQSANTSDIQEVIDPLSPTGWTPIGLSLEKAREDFSRFPGESNTNLIYIVSDGAETCEGNPAMVAKELAESDIQSIVNVIGFNVGIEGQNNLREIAEAGGGIYTNSGDEEELKEALGQGEALIKKWNEWKQGEKADIYEQRREQEVKAISEENEWRYTISDEFENHRSVLHALAEEGYISQEAYDYLYDRMMEKRDLYIEIRDTKYKELLDEIEKKYEETLERINKEYNKNIES